ncbi:MAG: SIS domain-containing protein [Candidatus Brocadiaceae bacterium]|jgi:arabinose-5-phosphate isomerase
MTDLSPTELVTRAREVVMQEASAVEALADQFDQRLAAVLETLLSCSGHILVTGAGTSHAVALRLAHLLACVGMPALYISAADGLHGGSGAVTGRDLVYVISKGGRSEEVNQFVRIARDRGATVIAQTETADSPLAGVSDLVYGVRTVGEVDPYGMVATGSSLVNCAAADVLCVLLLEASGYSREDFGATHPGGAVGDRLAEGDN